MFHPQKMPKWRVWKIKRCRKSFVNIMWKNINKCHKNANFQPSWPKSSVNFFSFTRSSSFTVGLVFSSDLDMSSWDTDHKIKTSSGIFTQNFFYLTWAYQANYRLQEFIARHVHPGHLDCVWVVRRAGRQEVIHDIIRVVPCLSSDLLKQTWRDGTGSVRPLY